MLTALWMAWLVAGSGCTEPTPIDAILTPGATVLLGETHGTREAPARAGDVACRAARLGHPIWLGLELPREEQRQVDDFLASGDVQPLLAAPFWQRAQQDGRSSLAMLTLLGQVRELRLDGIDIHVFLFDAEDPPADRNADMAGAIERVRAREH